MAAAARDLTHAVEIVHEDERERGGHPGRAGLREGLRQERR